MKSIIFTFDNIRKIETFLNGKLNHYFGGDFSESAEFSVTSIVDEKEIKKNLKFEKGDVIYKDRQGNIFKKLN